MKKPVGAKCEQCPLARRGRPRDDHYVPDNPASGRPWLTIVGDYPRFNESDKSIAYARGTSSRRKIDKALKAARVQPSKVGFYTAIACWDRDASKNDLTEAAKACSGRLRLPAGVPTLAMGAHALWATEGLAGFSKWRGARAPGGTWVSDSINQIYANPHYQAILAAHIERARQPPMSWPRIVIRDGPRMRAALQELLDGEGPLAVDIEDVPTTGKVLCIGVGNEDMAVSVPWEIGPAGDVKASSETQALLRQLLATDRPKTGQNLNHDIRGLSRKGLEIRGRVYDTMFAAHVLRNEVSKGLQFLAGLYFPVDAWKAGFVTSADEDLKGSDLFEKRDEYDLREYNCKDVIATARVWARQAKELDAFPRGWEHYQRMEEQGQISLLMEEAGMPISEEQRAEMHAFVSRQTAKFKAAFEAHAGGIDAGKGGTTRAVREYFFDTLKTPVLEGGYTSSGAPSLSKSILKRLTSGEGKPPPETVRAAELLLQFKLYSKLQSAFTSPESFPIAGGRARPFWKTAGTVTLRRACAQPNIQQMPEDMRAMFVAPKGFVFVEADWSQAEPRITADLSEDPRLLEVYTKGLDLYRQVGTALFKVPYDSDVITERRKLCKIIWLSSAYGTGAKTMSIQAAGRGVFLSKPQAAMFIRRLREGFPKMAAWKDGLVEKAELDGYIEEPYTGWRRYFPDGMVEAPKAFNWPMQAGAASLMNRCMSTLSKRLDWKGQRIVAQIHDALTLMVPEDEGQDWARELESIMHVKLNHIDLVASAKVSPCWLDAH